MLTTRTKLLCTLVFMLGLSTTIYGQEYDLKKDVILLDKVPYAKFSGKFGMLKPADVMISSLNGDSLIAIKQWLFPSGNPVFGFLSGYQIRFVASGKTMVKPCNSTLNKEQFLNFILCGKNYEGKWEILFPQSLIVNNAVDPAVEAAFIEKFDKHRAIEAATEYEKSEREMLAGIFPIQRDTKAALKFEGGGVQPSPKGTLSSTSVYQGGKLIATIVRESETSGAKHTYTFQHTLNQKVSVGGTEVDYIVIATATVDSFPKIYVNVDGKSKSIEIKNPAAAERELTEYLISNQKL